MKILLVHNRYRIRGGEDRVFDDEVRLLLREGHEVIPVTARWGGGDGLAELPARAGEAIWNDRWHGRMRRIIERHRPDLVHSHNLFPVLSPSVLAAARQAGLPTVATLHNYRLLCPAATLFRDGRACEDCVGRLPWRGVIHGCYHDSILQSAAVAWMIAAQRRRGAWESGVDRFIVPSEFARGRLAAGGLPEDRLIVKPHVIDPDPGAGTAPRAGHALWVGRLSPEKGVSLLIEGWRRLPGVALRVAGAGPLLDELQAASLRGVDLLPRLTRRELFDEMRSARFLVSTSLCYETFGLVVAEAFACATPAIVPSGGALAELVTEGRTGLVYAAGDAGALARKVRWAWEHPREMEAMGREARRTYEAKYSAAAGIGRLLDLYAELVG